ncbi:MAG: hypothetical protein ACJAWI_000008 [Marinomonas primoryensis]|jgi:hypothetical protein
MTGQRIGYIRVSSADQNPERQLEGFELDRTFTDKASAKDTNRPELNAIVGTCLEADTANRCLPQSCCSQLCSLQWIPLLIPICSTECIGYSLMSSPAFELE